MKSSLIFIKKKKKALNYKHVATFQILHFGPFHSVDFVLRNKSYSLCKFSIH